MDPPPIRNQYNRNAYNVRLQPEPLCSFSFSYSDTSSAMQWDTSSTANGYKLLGYLRSDVLPNMPKHVAVGAGSILAKDPTHSHPVKRARNRVGNNCSR